MHGLIGIPPPHSPFFSPPFSPRATEQGSACIISGVTLVRAHWGRLPFFLFLGCRLSVYFFPSFPFFFSLFSPLILWARSLMVWILIRRHVGLSFAYFSFLRPEAPQTFCPDSFFLLFPPPFSPPFSRKRIFKFAPSLLFSFYFSPSPTFWGRWMGKAIFLSPPLFPLFPLSHLV